MGAPRPGCERPEFHEDLPKQNASLRAENERLREALKRIVLGQPQHHDAFGGSIEEAAQPEFWACGGCCAESFESEKSLKHHPQCAVEIAHAALAKHQPSTSDEKKEEPHA
jgi:hypothetical protein